MPRRANYRGRKVLFPLGVILLGIALAAMGGGFYFIRKIVDIEV